MVITVLTVEGDEGGAHLEMYEVQAKVDCVLGLSGEFSCEIYHRFTYRCDFYLWVHVDLIH